MHSLHQSIHIVQDEFLLKAFERIFCVLRVSQISEQIRNTQINQLNIEPTQTHFGLIRTFVVVIIIIWRSKHVTMGQYIGFVFRNKSINLYGICSKLCFSVFYVYSFFILISSKALWTLQNTLVVYKVPEQL